MVGLGGVEVVRGFLNSGCAILESWKTGRVLRWGDLCFPRLPQESLAGLCKGVSLCEKRVRERMVQGVGEVR